MPLINPHDIIKSNFKILSKKKKSSQQPGTTLAPEQVPVYDTQQYAYPPQVQIIQPLPMSTMQPMQTFQMQPTQALQNMQARQQIIPPDYIGLNVQDNMLPNMSSEIMDASTEESRSVSNADGSSSRGSVYVLVERSDKTVLEKRDIKSLKITEDAVLVDKDGNKVATVDKLDDDDNQKQREFTKKKVTDDDRRKNTWIPCTCPQYKVSKDLASKWDLQSIFFGKILVAKVVQLLIINLAVFTTVIESNSTKKFFRKNHDWAFLAYGIFIALLMCVRWSVGYRSRWPLTASVIIMIPLTLIIAFTTACIASVYNSILIPSVTCTLLLTFIMLVFAPYVLRKSVMHRSTNFSGSGLALLSSVVLLFLKEFEPRPMSYWEFVTRVWLPGLILSQMAVQVTIFEIQRIIFGLCFNVSTKRWHIAALYI